MTAEGREAERGFALILVVWFLVLIGAIGTYLVVNARAETAIARNVRAAANAEALADAGVARVVFNLTDPALANRWKLDGAPHPLALPGGGITIRVTDETRKINPNLASEDLLRGLFEAVGVERTQARQLGAAMADWVSPEGPAREGGAKLEQYRAAGRPYGPPNAPAESLDELALVLGMTPTIMASVQPYLTIFGEAAEPNAVGAPPVIRRALLLAAQKSPSNDDGADAKPDVKPQAAPDAKPERLIGADITARSRDGGVFVRHVVLRIETSGDKPYTALDWQRGTLDPRGD